MKAIKYFNDWRESLKHSSLFVVISVIIVTVVVMIIQSIQEIRNASALKNLLQDNIVIVANSEVVFKKQLKTDTINVYVNKVSIEQVDIKDLDSTNRKK